MSPLVTLGATQTLHIMPSIFCLVYNDPLIRVILCYITYYHYVLQHYVCNTSYMFTPSTTYVTRCTHVMKLARGISCTPN